MKIKLISFHLPSSISHLLSPIFCLLFLLLSSFNAYASTVTVETIHSYDGYEQSGKYPILIRIEIAKGWFIHGAAEEEEYLIPTVLSFEETVGLKIPDIKFPEPEKKKFEYTSKPVEVYSGRIYIEANLTVSETADAGNHTVRGVLSYQACSETSCRPPEDVAIEIPVAVLKAGSSANQINSEVFLAAAKEREAKTGLGGFLDRGILWALPLIFLGGLALNLTPCVYPLITISVSYFVGRGQRPGSETILMGIVYLCGLAVTNSVLGVVAALSGGMLGSALQYPIVLVIIACIMVVLGSRFWEIRLPSALTKAASKNYKGYFGTFFMGLTLGIVAAPCIGPFVLMLLTHVGQKGDPLIGFLYFFILSLGMGLPLCILAIFSGAIDRLPRSGDWMIWVRKLMGWVMIGMGWYYVSSLIPGHLLRYLILLLLAVIAGIHLGWIDRSGKNLRVFRYVKKAAAIIIILSGLFYSGSALESGESIQWKAYDEAVMRDAAADNKPVILDIYADWCMPCREMEKTVFKNPEVVKLSIDFITLRLDITRKQPEQEDIRKRLRIEGAPTIIFFDRDGRELEDLRIEQRVEHEEFLKKMKKAL